ncbi:hypothetical protein Q3G72_026377 [Acer saccharum]|nr:hypothetical protein Q3G72_026377 [Acer saccharum]
MNTINRTDEVGKIDVVKKGLSKSGVNNSGRSNSSVNQGSRKMGGSRFNKPFKEIVKGESLGSIGKVYRVGKQSGKLDDNQQEKMEDDLEDSDVLKALHQEMLDSVLIDKDTRESSMETVGDSGPIVCIEHVDVPSASNFDEVASKLKEAMEVAME